MFQLRAKIRMNAAELAGSGEVGYFLQLQGGVTGVIGVICDVTTGSQLVIVRQIGGTSAEQVSIETTFTAGQEEKLVLNMFPQAGGYLKVRVFYRDSFWGEFTTSVPILPTTLVAGYIKAGGGTVDREIIGVRMGRSPNASDIFSDGGYIAGTIVPPWATTHGAGLALDSALSPRRLNVSGSGTASAYVSAPISVLVPPAPPPPVIPPPPAEDHIIYVGDAEWKSAGQPRWQLDGWELDRVVVPFSGKVTLLESFLSGKSVWQAWDRDSNMYLQDLPQDDHLRFPTVNLTYIGKRGGTLPPDRNSATSSLQQVSGVVFSNSYILTFGLPPHWEARITYISNMTRFVTWTTSIPDFDAITAPAPPGLTTDDIVSLVIGGIDYSVWGAVAANYGGIVQWVLGWFQQRTARFTEYQEMVPGKYYRAQVTTQVLLLPVQEEIVS